MNIRTVAVAICLVSQHIGFVSAENKLIDVDSPEAILEKLRQVEGSVESTNFSVNCRYTSRLAFKPDNLATPRTLVALKTTAQTEWIMGLGGSRCYTYLGKTTNVLADESTFDIAMASKSVFDARNGKGRTITKTRSPEGKLQINDRTRDVFGGGACPLQMAGFFSGLRPKDLTSVKVVDQLTLDGYVVAVLRTEPKRVEDENATFYAEVWVDTERWVTVRKRLFVQNEAGQPFEQAMQVKCEQFVHVTEGIWLPGHIHVWRWNSNAKDFLRKGRESHFAYEDWKTSPEMPEDHFAMQFEVGDPTSDK